MHRVQDVKSAHLVHFLLGGKKHECLWCNLQYMRAWHSHMCIYLEHWHTYSPTVENEKHLLAFLVLFLETIFILAPGHRKCFSSFFPLFEQPARSFQCPEVDASHSEAQPEAHSGQFVPIFLHSQNTFFSQEGGYTSWGVQFEGPFWWHHGHAGYTRMRFYPMNPFWGMPEPIQTKTIVPGFKLLFKINWIPDAKK